MSGFWYIDASAIALDALWAAIPSSVSDMSHQDSQACLGQLNTMLEALLAYVLL